MEITNDRELEEHLMSALPRFLEHAEVDEDSVHAFIQFLVREAE
jgi:hypothetical protein